ncbi:MAG: hypothetical protein WCF85_16020 [Rhodospirillaceae bacterium]
MIGYPAVMTTNDSLSLVIFSGGFDRVHYALAMASAAAATGRRVTLLVTGRALTALLPADSAGVPGWGRLDPADDGSPPARRDHYFTEHGIAGFEELLEACAALGVGVIACEMGLRALGLPSNSSLRADLPTTIGGIVTFLNASAGGTVLFI